jgi:hypothetical protein
MTDANASVTTTMVATRLKMILMAEFMFDSPW